MAYRTVHEAIVNPIIQDYADKPVSDRERKAILAYGAELLSDETDMDMVESQVHAFIEGWEARSKEPADLVSEKADWDVIENHLEAFVDGWQTRSKVEGA